LPHPLRAGRAGYDPGMAARKKPTRNPTPKKDWPRAFLGELARCGNVSLAAIKAGVHRSTAYERRDADPEFARTWDEAVAISVELMAGEARRRAVEGVLEPVFQGGKKVGTVRRFSDTLLIFLLKAHGGAAYRDANRVTVGGDPANPVKHEHAVNVFQRIAELAAGFAGEEEGGPAGDRP